MSIRKWTRSGLLLSTLVLAGIVVLGAMAVLGSDARKQTYVNTVFSTDSSGHLGSFAVSVPVESSMGGDSMALDRIIRQVAAQRGHHGLLSLPSQWADPPVDRATRARGQVERELIVSLGPGWRDTLASSDEKRELEQAVASEVRAYAREDLAEHVLFEVELRDTEDAVTAVLTLAEGERWPGKIIPEEWVTNIRPEEGVKYAVLECSLQSRRMPYEYGNTQEVTISKKGLPGFGPDELRRFYIITIDGFPIPGEWARSVYLPAAE